MVARSGQRLLELAGGVVGVDAPAQRSDDDENEVGAGGEEIEEQPRLPARVAEDEAAVEEDHKDGEGQGAGDKAEQGRRQVDQADAILRPGELGFDEGIVLAGRFLLHPRGHR